MTNIERHIFARMFEHERKYGKRATYLICDLDTRFSIMDECKSIIIRENGRYLIMDLTICIVDGLTNETILEVK